MTIETLIGVLAAAMTIINAILVVVMRGVSSELRVIRAEVATRFAEFSGAVGTIEAKLDGAVNDRLHRFEGELAELRSWRREVDRHLAELPRRRGDKET